MKIKKFDSMYKTRSLDLKMIAQLKAETKCYGTKEYNPKSYICNKCLLRSTCIL